MNRSLLQLTNKEQNFIFFINLPLIVLSAIPVVEHLLVRIDEFHLR